LVRVKFRFRFRIRIRIRLRVMVGVWVRVRVWFRIGVVLGRNILPSGPKMETVCSSETSVSTYESTLRLNPEDQRRLLNSVPFASFHVYSWISVK
jgi:hypothetical protein